MTVSETHDASGRRGASHLVYLGVMKDLEAGRMVPGQRLIETDLASRFGVGRNAVREAMQLLTARGVVDLSRHRSPAIRLLDLEETMEVLDVAGSLTGLAARSAAIGFAPAMHGAHMGEVLNFLQEAHRRDEPEMFSKARRNFYRAILHIGRNRELQRLFPAIGMHIIYAQYQSRTLREIRLSDYRNIINAICTNNPEKSENYGKYHVENVRKSILSYHNKNITS